ncbi:MAG TPA: phosphoribosylformylglycinamidine synthase subunit PurL [Candidatus Sulfotelmatobacter sp.]|nr:phosphoribosylformylglycinamidine synthase subunit PurL [Candidatus Sulfotelmatobacter sp.]
MTAVLDDAVELGRRAGVALSDDELRSIAEHLGRVPTVTELFAFDAQWSEHCSYKSSRGFLRKLPTDGPTVLLGVGEDAGIVRLGEWQGETYGIVMAHESHNHPSQVVPFEGAATGIGGIVRDVLCMGAEVIGLADPLRFGRLENAHCRYVAQSVVDGIAAYGNAIGVPNLGGDVFFDASFDDNVLVNVVALGLVKENDVIHSRAPEGSVGWDIVLVGKATDRSGFGGASFSSLTLDEEDAQANKGAVQVPDPFLKNVLMRASYAVFAQLRAQAVTAGFKDLGAGGLAGCSAELCAAGGVGAEIELERVVTAQRDLPPEVIAIGETQERLCWIVPPSFTPTLLEIYNDVFALPRIARGACAAVIGKVTETNRYVARYRGETVMDVDLPFLTGGIRCERPHTPPHVPHETEEERERTAAAAIHAHPATLGERLRAVLAHRDVCARTSIYQRYDGVVRGCTAIPPGYADAGVLVPVPGAPLGLALAVGGNPRYGAIDPKRAAELAVAEAIGHCAAVGARAAGLSDCLNFGDPTVPEQMGQFVAAVDGLADAARALGVPFVTGNVSLYNRSANGNAVAPSPIVGCVGTFDDVSVSATMGLKRAGAALVVTAPLEIALAGTVIAELLQLRSTTLPSFHAHAFGKQCDLVIEALETNLISAAHLVTDGGVLAAIAKMAFASHDRLGFAVDPTPVGEWVAHDVAYFSETPAFIVEVDDAEAFALLAARLGVSTYDAGTVIQEPEARLGDERIPLAELREAWEAPLRDFYGSAA